MLWSRSAMMRERHHVDGDDHLRCDQRIAADGLPDADAALGRSVSDALEALRADGRLGQAVGTRRTSAPCARATRFPVLMVEAGRHFGPNRTVRVAASSYGAPPWRTR